uniref:Carbohydrate sulfotransferase n=1 Tax=Astyanax mexicanus TaxID=7994 RepID=A0A8B9LCD2_ASTMX
MGQITMNQSPPPRTNLWSSGTVFSGLIVFYPTKAGLTLTVLLILEETMNVRAGVGQKRVNIIILTFPHPHGFSLPNSELSNLLVDDRHGIIYCYVPKVACSEWKRIMIVLSESLKVDGVPYRHPSDIPEEQIHGNTTQYLNQYPREVMKHKLQHYKKFMFVRDPFVRLISAFRDKFLKENQPFYKYVAVKILKKFSKVHKPPKTAKEAFTAGIVPSFLNFIQYILSLPEENYTLLDEHWRQAVHLCHPCLIDYDFIGKMETVEQDAAQLLRMLQVDNIVQFPKSRSNITDESWIKIWFPDIPTDWRRNLYKIYETDYILFGYRHPEDLLNE